jgi:hypothetical protein
LVEEGLGSPSKDSSHFGAPLGTYFGAGSDARDSATPSATFYRSSKDWLGVHVDDNSQNRRERKFDEVILI